MDLLVVTSSLIVCYFTGSIIENNHLRKLNKREYRLHKSPCITYGKDFTEFPYITKSYLVSGSVVVGCDYFKAFVARLRNFFGGKVSTYETVLERARREAVLRMRELAASKNAKAVINVKVETVMLDTMGANAYPKVCVTAYGTALDYRD